MSSVCDKCGVTIKHKSNLKRHMKEIHGNPKVYKCEYCPHSTLRKHDLFRHEKKFHSRETGCSITLEEELVESIKLERFLFDTEVSFYENRPYNINSIVTYYLDISTVRRKNRYIVVKYESEMHYGPVTRSIRIGLNEIDYPETYDLL